MAIEKPSLARSSLLRDIGAMVGNPSGLIVISKFPLLYCNDKYSSGVSVSFPLSRFFRTHSQPARGFPVMSWREAVSPAAFTPLLSVRDISESARAIAASPPHPRVFGAFSTGRHPWNLPLCRNYHPTGVFSRVSQRRNAICRACHMGWVGVWGLLARKGGHHPFSRLFRHSVFPWEW